MEKNLEKSLKRYLKRKVKITTAFIVAFLLGSLAVYGATLDEIFANGELVKHSTKVGYEEKEFKIRYDKNNNSIVLEWSSGVWKKNSEIKIDSLNEVQKNSLLKSLEAFANSAQEELKPTTTENGINNGIILNIGDTETSSDPASAQEIASGVIINKGDIYSGGTVFITYSQNITGKNGVAVNDGNIYGIGSVGQKAFMGTVINNGNIFSNGQDIDNSVGINNGNIFLINKGWNNEAQGQEIKSNGIGVNAGNINSSYDDYSVTAQKIEGIGINVSDIFFTTNVSTVTGQKVASGVGINNKNIKLFSNKYDSMGQEIGGMGFNNGMISSEVSDKSNNGTAYGQKINTAGVGINNGVIYSSNANKDEEYGQTTDYNGVGINNGIIVADKAYYKRDYWSTFYKNGIALKKDDKGKVVINTGSDSKGEEYNNNIDILGKDKLTTSNKLSEVITNNNITQKDVGETSDGTKVKGYNLFINNLGNETDDSDKNNQLVIDTDLTGSFVNTHITTAVTNGNFDNNNGAVIKISKSGNTDKTFLMDKSTIAGYFEQNGTLADMTGATDITLSNSVISVSGKDNTIDTTAVKFGAGSTVALNSSTISGKIDFSAGGNNALNLNGKYNGDNNNSYKDGTQYGTYASDIEFGTGNDNIDIKFTETKDGNEVTDYNSSYDKKGLVTLGNVNFGDGNDTLSFSFDEMRKGNFVLAGNIDFGTGDDTVALKSKIDMNDKGETMTLLNNFLFNKIKNGTLETLQLADGGNTIRFEQNIGQDKLSLDFNEKILGGNGDDRFIISADKLKNNLTSLNGGADENKNPYNDNDILELTTAVDNTSDFILLKNVENVETLKLADVDGNKLDINNISTSNPDTLRFKNYVGGDKDDSFTVSIENFEKLSSIDGGGNGTTGDTLTINGEKDNTEIFLNKTAGIENFIMTSSKDFTHDNIIHINDWDYLNFNKDKISINLTQQANDNYIKGSKESIGSLKNITGIGNGYSTRVILTDNISDKNVSDKGTADEDYNFISKLNKVTNLYLANGDNYVDVNKIIEKNSETNSDKFDRIQYINLDNTSKGNSGTNYFKISAENLNSILNPDLNSLPIKIDVSSSTNTEDTLEITTPLENDELLSISFIGIEKLVLSGEKDGEENNILINSDLVDNGFNEIRAENSGKNIFRIEDAYKNDNILGIKIVGGSSANDTLKIDTENITLSDKYNTLEKVLINKTGIENLVLGNADNTIDFTYTDKDDPSKNLKDFKNITSGNGNDKFTVSVDNIGSMKINGGENAEFGDTLILSGILDNDTQGKENILSGVSNIENLYLNSKDKGNILNIDNTNGFALITSEMGDDTFKVSADKLSGITIRDKGSFDNDTLEITEGGINNTGNDDFLKNISSVENLILADNSSNFVKLDNVSFNTITKNGTGNDEFSITSNSDKLKMTINGGSDNDVIKIENIVVDNTSETGDTEYLKNIHGVESLNLSNNGGNKLFFNKDNINDFKFISAINNNSITLDNLENITVRFEGNTDGKNLTIKNDNGIFNHEVTNASKITLGGDNKVWKFADNTINGNTILNLSENTLSKNSLEFSEKLSLGTDGKLSFGNVSFVADGRTVTLENGNIKVGLSDNVTFDKGINTRFTLTGENEIAFGSALNLETYSFLNSSYDSSAKEFNITVKSWDELIKDTTTEENKLFADTYDYILKEYYNQNKDTDKTITNAFNSFGTDAIAKYIETVKNHGLSKELVLNSESGTFESEVKGKVLIGTDETTKGNNDLIFKNISANNFEINVAEGTENNISLNGAVTLNNGIDGSNSNGKINISLKENSSINLGNINFGAEKGTLEIGDTSVIEKIGKITNGEKITVGTADADGFNKVLASSNGGVENISVKEKAEIEIKNNYSGNLSFEKENNTLTLKSNENFKDYSGNIVFEKGGNTLTVAENINADGKISVNGETNNITVNGTANALAFGQNSNKNAVAVNGKLSSLGFTGNSNENKITVNGTLENGIDFGDSSHGNILIVSENGTIGKDIKFGTGAGDEFTIALKDNGIFDYNVTNADVINISGVKGEIKFGENSSITSNSEITLNTNGGVIAFNINKDGNIISKNPFGNTSVKVNGDIKITLYSSVRFGSLSDKINLGLGNIKSDNILTSAFLNYNGSEFSIKSAEELKAFGLGDYAFGNYEYAILNYNKAGYEGITSMLNNNNLTDISKALNKGIEQKDFYFYSDDREIKDKITLGNINIETSKDNQVTGENLNTDIKFTNVTGGTANINFAQGTTNSVSFLDGVNISKIDGSSSNAGFTLNLDGINFSKSQDAKDNTEVVMSDYADTLNINSKLEGIGINTGDGEDIVNISSYVKNITLNTGAGNDTVNILSSANGIFDGDSGDNTLNIGAKTQTLSNENSQDEIVLNGEIKNFQDINLNQNTKLESSLKISQNNQSEKINLNLNGNSLFVDVDYTKKADDKVIGHALYDNGIKVDNSTGKVMIDTAKANDGTIISLGTAGNKTEFASTDKEHLLESGSSNHHIEMIDGDIVVKVNEHIMGDSETGAVKYAHLDKIYQSIVSADKIKEMAETTTLSDKTKDEAIKAQLEFYGKIYHSTPYAYSNDVSKKSADLITESIMNLKVMPEYKHWVFGGSIVGQEADSDSNFYGSNHYNGIDIGKNEVSADTNIYGAYAFGKYGIGVNQSVGFAIAGTRSDTDISGNSKLEGDGIYVSAFAEQEINNLKFLAGISYQHSFYDSTRNVSNDYQRMSVDKKYEDDLVSIFAGGKYSYHLGNNFFAEPNVKLSVTHIMQDSIDEGDNGKLTIETDKKDFTFVEGEVGIDLVKKINLSKGTLNLRAGTSLVYLLDGYQEEYLTGRITGSSKSFEMISPEDDRTKVKFTVGTEYEMTNGMFMNLHGNYTTSSHTEDYAVSFGAGYKF